MITMTEKLLRIFHNIVIYFFFCAQFLSWIDHVYCFIFYFIIKIDSIYQMENFPESHERKMKCRWKSSFRKAALESNCFLQLNYILFLQNKVNSIFRLVPFYLNPSMKWWEKIDNKHSLLEIKLLLEKKELLEIKLLKYFLLTQHLYVNEME